MTIILDLPDELMSFLATYGPTPEGGALAVIALNMYREGKLSTAQLRRVLGFHTRIHVHAFLKEHDVLLQYGAADLEHDRQAGDSIQIQPAVWAEESTP